jgi:hypothetical protein
VTRADQERARLAHALARVRITVESVALNAEHDGAGLLNAAQALSQVSAEVLVIAARIDAYERAEVLR